LAGECWREQNLKRGVRFVLSGSADKRPWPGENSGPAGKVARAWRSARCDRGGNAEALRLFRKMPPSPSECTRPRRQPAAFLRHIPAEAAKPIRPHAVNLGSDGFRETGESHEREPIQPAMEDWQAALNVNL